VSNEKNINLITEKFAGEYPSIYNSAGRKINIINLEESYPLEPKDIILSGDFSQNNSNWKLVNDDKHQIQFNEGEMKIDNRAADSSLVTRNIELPDKFDLIVETTWNGGENNKAYGLLIGNEETQCLKFSITGGGYYSIFRWDYGRTSSSKPAKMWSEPRIVGWSKSGFLRLNAGDKNILRVQKTTWYGSVVGVIAFFINDRLVARNIYYVTPPMGGSGIQFKKTGITGIFAYGKQAVSFSNFYMSTLK
jgi:hypothetical protein